MSKLTLSFVKHLKGRVLATRFIHFKSAADGSIRGENNAGYCCVSSPSRAFVHFFQPANFHKFSPLLKHFFILIFFISPIKSVISLSNGGLNIMIENCRLTVPLAYVRDASSLGPVVGR